MMGDIDRFKACNDQYGHACGDYVLQQVAKLLQRTAARRRHHCPLGRGGVHLPAAGNHPGGRRTLAEKLRSTLERTHLTYEGIRAVPDHHHRRCRRLPPGMSLEDCVARADAALYAGKQAGRNRVVVDRRQHGLGATRTELPSSA